MFKQLKGLFKKQKPPTIKEFYQQHKNEILKLVATDHLERTTIRDLKYEFTSYNGKKYYSFPEREQMPFIRVAEGIKFMECLRNGISLEDMQTIYNKLQECLAHIKAKSKQADEYIALAGVLVNDLTRRINTATPYYVLVNLAANYLIREDEDPQVISPTIFSEKCDDIEYEILHGNNAFFLTLPQLKPLSVIQQMSPSELTEYLTQLNNEAIKETQTLKLLFSWTGFEKYNKTGNKA